MNKNQLDTSHHPMGELSKTVQEKIIGDTFEGPIQVEWDKQAPVTPMGQLIFFVQFLKTCNLFSKWTAECPLEYKSPNAPRTIDVLGTILLSILSGHKRYAHITSIRYDNVNSQLLGMKKVLSEDSVRRAFKNVEFEKFKKWQIENLEYCYGPLLNEKWILDIDSTIKVLYGNQEGAEIGYNPTKPGRPSHIIHTYMMAETKLIIDSEVLPGKQSASSYFLPRLIELIDSLPENKKPDLIRGDCAFGNEKVLSSLENRNMNFLFKIKHTKRVKELIQALEKENNYWMDAGQNWEGIEGSLRLMGWSKKRKVIVLRRAIKGKKTRGRKSKAAQLLLPFLGIEKDIIGYEYSVLVTSLEGEVLSLAQLYRDRATCENNFDELKNQWGWAGFVTKDLNRSRIMVRAIVQVYNWWSLFVRWIDPEKHSEAITSRPLMLFGVAKKTKHANQKKLTITSMHGNHQIVYDKITLITNFLRRIKHYAEQFTIKEIWRRVLSAIFIKFLNGRLLKDDNCYYLENFIPQINSS